MKRFNFDIDLFNEMLDKQNELNKELIGENWINNPPNFQRAIVVETVELMDHIGYNGGKNKSLIMIMRAWN